MLLYLYFFKDYTAMTERRLDKGMAVLREAFRI